MQHTFYENPELARAFAAKKALDWVYLILEQAKAVYDSYGMRFPVVTSSTLLALGRRKRASQSEIARILEHPHQTIAQHLRALMKLGLVVGNPSSEDSRVTDYTLTRAGKEQHQRLEDYTKRAAITFEEIFDSIGVDLIEALDAAIAELKREPLEQRFGTPISAPSKKRVLRR